MPQIRPSVEPLPMVAAAQMKKDYFPLNLTINSSVFEVCLFWVLDILYYLCCRDHWERLDRRSNLRHNLRNLRLGIKNPPTKTTEYISNKGVNCYNLYSKIRRAE